MSKPRGLQGVEQSFIAAAWDSPQWDNALEVAAAEFGADGAMLLPVQGAIPHYAVTESFREPVADFISSGWHKHDERARGIPVLLRDGALIEHDFTNEEEVARLPYYQDLMRRNGFCWFGGMLLTAGNDRWCVAFQRKLGADPYNFRDKARLARWGRRLSVAANLAHDVGTAKAALIGDLLEALGKPCLLLDRRGDVTRMNALAEALLGPHAACRKGRLTFSDRAASEAFAAAARAVLSPDTALDAAGPVAVPREGRRPLALSLTSLDAIDGNPFAPARVLVLIDDLDARPLTTPDRLKAVFGLTGAEAALASILSEGENIGDAAGRLHITQETAKSHLKKIFQKTDTGKQTALIALLARLGGSP
jgi:DNA-binding CsgD family transcriptional regulator/PAS domain-containing protein